MKKIGFIGTGNMGYPLLCGAIRTFGAENVTYSTPVKAEVERVQAETGVPYVENNIVLAENCEMIVLCVKPQFIGGVFEDIKKVDLTGKTIVSIAAGISIDTIKNSIGGNVPVIRIMPNTPAMVLEGMSCICYSEDPAPGDEAKEDVLKLFNCVGKTQVISETLMNAAICANGSSPAYVYMFIEALADSVVQYGLPRAQAYTLAAQTVLGAAKMVLETGEHPGALKDKVCSPGGTTIAAVAALEEYGFRNAIIKATDACYKKSEELAAKNRKDK